MQIRALGPSIGCSLGPSCGASRWALAAALGCALAGCYAAVAPPGAPCESSLACPTDQQCVTGFCSYSAGRMVDAGAPAPVPVDSAPGDAPPADAGSPATCQSSDACATAKTLGTVSGDTGNQTLTASGTRAAWLRVRVTEDASPSDGSMRVLAKLTPPAGEDFDVFVYVDPDMDTPACPSGTGTVTTSGPGKQVPASWRDLFYDASRNVSIEVRPRSASCSPTAKWQLVIEGNAN
jgi:hypothetical protein